MSEQNPKITCSLCGAYLFEDDDTVYCPTCGAPHHRECYNTLGHCALEEAHGTPNQYKKFVEESEPQRKFSREHSTQNTSSEMTCGMCGTVYDKDENSCPNCGTPNMIKMGRAHYRFDFLGGIDPALDLGEGVTADEAKRFVFSNSQRYIPRFAANKAGKKSSWNWIAFLFPCEWFLCRKMYKIGAFIGAVSVALSMLIMPFMSVFSNISPDDMNNYTQMYDLIAANMDKFGIPVIIAAAASVLLNLVVRIICGIFGDYFYRNHVIGTVKTLKAESEDLEEDFRKKGGVNFLMFLVGFLAVSELPNILAMFIGL